MGRNRGARLSILWIHLNRSLAPERRLRLVEAIGHPAVRAVRRLRQPALRSSPQLPPGAAHGIAQHGVEARALIVALRAADAVVAVDLDKMFQPERWATARGRAPGSPWSVADAKVEGGAAHNDLLSRPADPAPHRASHSHRAGHELALNIEAAKVTSSHCWGLCGSLLTVGSGCVSGAQLR
jgi:hypothetical protein